MFTARVLIGVVMGAALALPAGKATAQGGTWPSRPIRLVVPLPPGGSPDYLSRLLSERLQPVLGQPLVVENKPGGGGTIAREYVARQTADGYTLLMTESSHVLSAAIGSKLPYDPIRDFEPIVLAAAIPFVLAVNSNTRVRTLNEFIGYAKAAPKALTYGTAGVGAPHHIAAELLRSMTGINIVHVPYKGSAGIVPALLSGEIDFTIGAVNSLLPHFRSGKLRAIAVSGSARTAILPDAPTIAEAGPLPGYFAPVGLEPLGSTPEQFLEVMKSDLAKYAKVAKDANIKPE